MTCFKVNISNLRQAPPDFLCYYIEMFCDGGDTSREHLSEQLVLIQSFFFSQLKSVCLKTMLVFLTSVMLTGPAQ